MGNPLTIRDGANGLTQFTYNSLNLPLTVTDPLNNTTQFQYDTSGNLNRETGPTNAVTQHTYNARGQRLTTVSPVNGTTTYAYDSVGNLTSVTDPLNHVTTHEYNAAGLPTRTIDARNNDTLFEYDDFGRLHRVRQAGSLRESEFWQTDAAGRVLKHISATGGTTTFEYDSVGRLTRTTDPLGRVTQAEYDAGSRITAEINGLNQRTTYGYDAAGRVTSVTDPLSSVTQATYDAAGRQTAVTDPANYSTTFTYDAVGRVTTVTNPLNQQAVYTYDLAGQLTTYRNPRNYSTTFLYDARGLLTRVTDALNNITQYTYDAVGRQTAVIDARNNTTTYTYDLNGRPTQETRPGSLNAYSAYDPTGNRTSYTDFNGRTTYFAYDARNLLASITYPRDGQVTLTYDAAGRRSRRVDATGVYLWQYDTAGQLVRARDWMGYTLTYDYDAAGRNTRAGSQSFAYDTTGRMTRAPGVTYSYNTRSLVTQKTFDSGWRQTYGYDAAGRVIETRVQRSNGVDMQDNFYYYAHLQYTRDAQGQITLVKQRNPSAGWMDIFAYTYDAVDRLTSSVKDGSYTYNYAYDAVGNRISDNDATFLYDANNRLTRQQFNAGGSHYYANDANGNQTQICFGPNCNFDQVQRFFTYNDENRMTYDSGPASWWCDDICYPSYPNYTQHRYNGDGQRVHSTSDTGVYIRYDRDMPLADLRHSDGVPAGYYYRGRNGELVGVRDATNNLWEYALDERGSARWMVQSGGYPDITATYRYDPYGKDAQSAPGSVYNPLRFTGARYEPSPQFYLMGARYYIPQVGRFLTPDTYKGSPWIPWTQHLYVYVGNNPVNYIDPTGHFAWWVAGGVAGGLLGLTYGIYEGLTSEQGIDWADVTTYAFSGAMLGSGLGALTAEAAVVLGYGMSQAGLTAGTAITSAGMTGMGLSAGNVAANAANKVRLQRDLAVQEQMGSQGRMIAGGGSGIQFRDAAKIAKQYGGKPGDWTKMSSRAYTDSEGVQFETHWVENLKTGKRVEWKVKFKSGTPFSEEALD